MYADTVIQNGTIVTMDEAKSIHKAIAIKNGYIIALGSKRCMEPLIGAETQILDLEGKTAVPGLIDAHQHLYSTGFNLRAVDCNVSSIREMKEKIKKRAENSSPGEWIFGWGYDESKFEEKRSPTKADFEQMDHPVFITRYCLHTAVVNDAALKAAGLMNAEGLTNNNLSANTAGELTGVLYENAMELVKSKMPPYTDRQLKDAVLLAQEHYLKHGITSIHEAGMGFFTQSLNEFRVLQNLAAREDLKIRVYAMILDKFFSEASGMKLTSGFGNNRLKIGPIKMFADGTISGKSAAVSLPYRDSSGSEGGLSHSRQDLEAKVLESHREGYSIAIHAIGDAAVTQVLDAYEKAFELFPREDCRHRIEHASITNEALLTRMRKLGVIPVPQPTLVHLAGDVYVDHLAPDLLSYVFANQSFFDYGLKPAGSSDSPITPCSPLLGMYAAVSRKTVNGNVFLPNEKVSLYEALQMYTVNAAYASFDEDLKGTLEIGKLGDLTVLPNGFLNFSAEQVKNAEIEMTIIGGKKVYQKTQSAEEVTQ